LRTNLEHHVLRCLEGVRLCGIMRLSQLYVATDCVFVIAHVYSFSCLLLLVLHVVAS